MLYVLANDEEPWEENEELSRKRPQIQNSSFYKKSHYKRSARFSFIWWKCSIKFALENLKSALVSTNECTAIHQEKCDDREQEERKSFSSLFHFRLFPFSHSFKQKSTNISHIILYLVSFATKNAISMLFPFLYVLRVSVIRSIMSYHHHFCESGGKIFAPFFPPVIIFPSSRWD